MGDLENVSMNLDRRGFISSLAGVVAWVKSPKEKVKSMVSPAASAIQPTCSIDELSDGTNTVDQIVSIKGERAAVCNANFFQSGQMIDVHGPCAGFPYRGSFVVTENHVKRNEIKLSGPNLASVGAGDLLVVYGSQRTPTLMDIPYYQIDGSAGAYMGISRS